MKCVQQIGLQLWKLLLFLYHLLSLKLFFAFCCVGTSMLEAGWKTKCSTVVTRYNGECLKTKGIYKSHWLSLKESNNGNNYEMNNNGCDANEIAIKISV